MQYAKKESQSVVSTFVAENAVPSALSVDIVRLHFMPNCYNVHIHTYIYIEVQPQVRRAAELWLLPQVSEDPEP